MRLQVVQSTTWSGNWLYQLQLVASSLLLSWHWWEYVKVESCSFIKSPHLYLYPSTYTVVEEWFSLIQQKWQHLKINILTVAGRNHLSLVSFHDSWRNYLPTEHVTGKAVAVLIFAYLPLILTFLLSVDRAIFILAWPSGGITRFKHLRLRFAFLLRVSSFLTSSPSDTP